MSRLLDEDSDESFLGYCAIHSQTDRALFHWTDVARLYRLAGEPLDADIPEDGAPNVFWAMHEDEAQPLIKKARERLRDAENGHEWDGPIFPPEG